MNHPTESGEQCAKFGGATVDAAYDVERPVDVLAVVPRLLADEFDSIDLVGAAQEVDASKALFVESPE